MYALYLEGAGLHVDDIKIVIRSITVDEFIEMRQSVGWNYTDKESICVGLKNTLFSICAEINNKIIGYGRLIGDVGFTFYIQDVMVKPKYQNMGIGKKIIDKIMIHIDENYTNGSMICLLAAKGKESFYKRFGFIERPNEIYGAGMIKYVNK